MSKSLLSRVNFKLIGGRSVISKPPLFYLSIAFALGIWMSFQLSISFFSLFLVALIGLLILIIWISRVWFVPASLIFFFILGLLYGSNNRSLENHHILLSAPPGRISLEGSVLTVPETTKHGKKETISFVLRSKNFYRADVIHPTKGKVQVFLYNPRTEIHYGDYLRLKGSLEAPKQTSNPHVFDYGTYLAHQGIFRIFRGIGRYSVAQKKVKDHNNFLVRINQLRSNLQFRLSKIYPSPHSELAAALILGFRKNISDEINEAFIRTGTAHLLAISGMNISLVVSLFYFALSFLRIPRRFNFLMSVLFILIYTALAGANIPVLRAGIMGCMIFIGFLLGQERNLKSAFFFSFFLLLALDPNVLFTASFQLSFLAMASLLYILPRLEAQLLPKDWSSQINPLIVNPRFATRIWFFLRRSVIQSFLASLSATIGMFPVLLWYFNLFSVIGFVCNLVAIPLCTLATALTFLLLVIDFIYSPLAGFLSIFPLALFRFELWFIFKLSRFPFGHFYSPSPNYVFFIFYYSLLIIWLVAKFRIVPKFSSFLIILGTVVFLLSAQIPKSRSVFFDVGKNEAFFISFSNGSKCLINTGRHFPNNQAYWIIRSFLMARGIYKLDGIILTQLNAAHFEGLATVLDCVRVNRIFVAAGSEQNKTLNKYQNLKKRFQPLAEGSHIQFGSNTEIYIQILTVLNGKITSFLVHDQNRTMLYVLSAETETFKTLSNLEKFDFDLVYLPHHEFKLNQTEIHFLKQISSPYVVLNQRDQPDQFLSEIKSFVRGQVLLMETLGAVEFMNSKNGFIYKCYLQKATNHFQTFPVT